jgi:hypothetical protein
MLSICRLALTLLLGAAGIALIAFHAWLLVWRLAEGQIAEPVVALRWILAGVLVTALGALRRAGIPILLSRRGTVVWILVALLHAHTGGGPVVQSADARSTAALLVVLPVAATGIVASALLLTLGAGVRRGNRFVIPLRPLWALNCRPARPPADWFGPALPARAPPLPVV